MDFTVNFHIDCLSLELTGNKGDAFGNSKLMSFGFENQGFQINKENKVIKLNMFGLTLGTYNRFEELYKFGFRTKNTIMSVKEMVESQIKDDKYIQELKSSIEQVKFINK